MTMRNDKLESQGRTPLFLLTRRLRKDDKGVTAVEFALIAVPFFAIVIALLEVAVIHLTTLDLENGVKSASRQIRTGQAQEASFGTSEFKQAICNNTMLIRNCASNTDLVVDVKNFDDFSSVDTSTQIHDDGNWTDEQKFEPGAGSKVAVVRVYYKMKLMFKFPYVNLANVGDSHHMISSFFVFRNEPFS